MLARFRCDLHVHTCLSPCGDLDMSPRNVVETAKNLGLDVIAICDHNTAENVAAARRAALGNKGAPHVLCGLEICTLEEVHVLALFDHPRAAHKMQSLVYLHLPPDLNSPEIFGEQVAANENDEVEFFNQRLLIAAAGLDLEEVVGAIHELGGLAVAAHVDREAYGLLGNLGFFPDGLEIDAVEISRFGRLKPMLDLYPDLAGKPIIRCSDAHYVSEIGSAWTEFRLESPSIAELALAFKQTRGRQITCTGCKII